MNAPLEVGPDALDFSRTHLRRDKLTRAEETVAATEAADSRVFGLRLG